MGGKLQGRHHHTAFCALPRPELRLSTHPSSLVAGGCACTCQPTPVPTYAHHNSIRQPIRLALYAPERPGLGRIEAWCTCEEQGISIQPGGSEQVWPMSHELELAGRIKRPIDTLALTSAVVCHSRVGFWQPSASDDDDDGLVFCLSRVPHGAGRGSISV